MSAPAVRRGDGSGRKVMPGKDTTGDLFTNAMPAAPAPTQPDPASRRAAILEAFQRGDRLTHADALARGWGWRLAADVFALKEEHGWPIVSTMIPNPGGNDIAEYHLPADARQMGAE
jgi:hypothetical protein